MQQIPSIVSHPKQSRGGRTPLRQGSGGRVSSPRLRHSLEQSQDFSGLEDNVNRYDLLLLVKRAGKAAGFTSKMIQLLDYYMAYTRDCDWEEGSQPIVYQSLSKTSLDLGVSERQIQKLEKALFEAGALTWQDSGNHRRYGQRCPESGMILYAYGVDLTPLAYLRAELSQKLHEKELYDQAWLETKRQISYFRRQIRSHIAEMIALEEEGRDLSDNIEAFEADYEAIAIRIRTSFDLQTLHAMLEQHQTLHDSITNHLQAADQEQMIQKQADNESSEAIKEIKLPNKCSPKSDSNDIHYKYTNHELFNKLNTRRTATQSPPNSFQESSNAGYEIKTSDLSNDHSSEKRQKKGVDQDSSQNLEQGDHTPQDLLLSTGLQHITLKQALNASSERFREYMPIEPRPMNWSDFVEAAYKIKSHLHISQQSWASACSLLGRGGAAICVLLTDQAAQREEDPVRKPAAYFNAMMSRARAGELKLHKSIFGLIKREGEELSAHNDNPSSHRNEKGE